MAKRDLEALNQAMRDASGTVAEMRARVKANERKRCNYSELIPSLGIEAASLLTQVEYRWRGEGSKPFYKFIDECVSARRYDSWAGELGFTKYMVEAALDKVGTRVRGAQKAQELLKSGTELCHLVVYYKPSSGAMQWYFNESLFLKLRDVIAMKDSKAFPEISEIRNSKNMDNGHFENSGLSSSEQTHNKDIEQNAESLLQDETLWDTAVNDKKRKATLEKANKPKYTVPPKIVEDRKKGTVMPLDFSVDSSIMAEALEKYDNDTEFVESEAVLYKHHYTNVKPNATMVDFQRGFIDWWLVKGDKIRKANELKYGKANTRKDAGAERLSRLKELATTDIFGDQTFEELGRNLYKARYGSYEDSVNS